MNKTELINAMAEKAGLSKVDAKKALDAFVEAVSESLVKGDKVIVFKMKRRKDYRKKNGHRAQFTEVQIKEVIA